MKMGAILRGEGGVVCIFLLGRGPIFLWLRHPFPEGLCPHRGLHLHARNAFRLNAPSQLVIGYHWFAFLNQVLWTWITSLFNEKLTISQKLKNRTKKLKKPFQNIAYLLGRYKKKNFMGISRWSKIDHISKIKNCKNRKINFSFVSSNCASFI